MKVSFKILAVLVAMATQCVYAQYKTFPDSIRIEYPEQKALVTFQLVNVKEQGHIIQNFPGLLANLLIHVKKSITSSEVMQPHLVKASVRESGKNEGLIGHQRFVADDSGTSLSVEILEQASKTSFTARNNTITELLPPGWLVEISMRSALIEVYAPDLAALEALAALELQPALSSLERETKDIYTKRKGITSRMIYTQGAISFQKVDEGPIHDMIGLHIGAGIGLVRNNFYPELNFATALYFSNRHQQLRQRLELSYELKFFSGSTNEGAYRSLTNGFLNFSYGRNFSKERQRWTALGVGYLVNSNGSIFPGKTMKLFLESDIGNTKLNLVPEFYLTNDFKDFSFGLKLRYRF